MKAARFANVPLTEALGIPWSIWLERWCVIAMEAEAEAEEHFIKKARNA